MRELVALEAGIRAEGATSFADDDPIFAGHFPGNPIVPGVILTEALAQTAGIVAASGYPNESKPIFLLSAIRGMKFFRPVRPKERIILRATKLGQMQDLLQFKVEATVAETLVAEGQIVLSNSTSGAAHVG